MFAGWHEPIADFLDATEEAEILKNGARDCPPLRRWGRGLVTLLGDAAHPCTPNLGQGGCMALEDAMVLAKVRAESAVTGNCVPSLRIAPSSSHQAHSAAVPFDGPDWAMAEPALCDRTRTGDSDASGQADRTQLEKSLLVHDVIVMRVAISTFLISVVSIVIVKAGDSTFKSDEIYKGWMQMYDLKFDEAHKTFGQWQESHPTDCLAPASDAAAYLFSELARLGALESELFVNDKRFINRKRLVPDPDVKRHFMQRIDQADRLADSALQKSNADTGALFVKSLTCGLRADYAALVNKQNLRAFLYTKEGRPYADRLLAADPEAFDAYLGPGVENYLLSLKPKLLQILLRITGTSIDRKKGIEQLQKTALHGYYLEPFAKLLLAVAAARDNHPEKARELLTELHNRFPDNKLYSRELDGLVAADQ